jgi:hypothetical protein
VKTDACWTGGYSLEGNKFINFDGKTQRGKDLKAFDMNPTSPDFFPIVKGKDNEFIDCDDSGFGNFYDPPEGWANVKDCGNFPCTAPWNILFKMQDTKFTGIQPTFAIRATSSFELIADNPGFAPYVPNCEFLSDNNMWVCQENALS